MVSNKNTVNIVIFKKNRQLIKRKITPKDDSFKINEKSYIIDAENYYIWRNKATYTYVEDVPVPLQLKDLQVINGKESIPLKEASMSAKDLETFKTAKVSKEIFETIDSKTPESLILMAFFGVMVIGFGFLWFTFTNQYNEIMLVMRELLEIFAGGGN